MTKFLDRFFFGWILKIKKKLRLDFFRQVLNQRPLVISRSATAPLVTNADVAGITMEVALFRLSGCSILFILQGASSSLQMRKCPTVELSMQMMAFVTLRVSLEPPSCRRAAGASSCMVGVQMQASLQRWNLASRWKLKLIVKWSSTDKMVSFYWLRNLKTENQNFKLLITWWINPLRDFELPFHFHLQA